VLIGTEHLRYRLLARYVALFRIRCARKTPCAEGIRNAICHAESWRRKRLDILASVAIARGANWGPLKGDVMVNNTWASIDSCKAFSGGELCGEKTA
jgi:hypothetical protein